MSNRKGDEEAHELLAVDGGVSVEVVKQGGGRSGSGSGGQRGRELQFLFGTIAALALFSAVFLFIDMSSRPGHIHLQPAGNNNEIDRVPAEDSAASTSTLSKQGINDPPPATTDRYDFAVHEYSHILNRSPPHGFTTWIQMALNDKCVTSFEAYAQIYKDLQPWFVRGSIGPTDLELPAGRTANHHSYANGSDFTLGLQDLFLRAKTKDFEYLENGWDEPIVLPATDGYSNEVWEKPEDMFQHNSCLKERYDSENGERVTQAHSFFMNPDTFVSVNKLVPVFSQAKPDCYKDLLIPLGHNHISITQGGHVKDPILWSQKKNVLFWRGSSSDGHHGARYPLWRQAHRVRLVDWAENFRKAHPNRVFDAGVSDPSSIEGPLMVDIGFHNYVQCDEGGCKELRERFPQKKSVSFDKTIEFKYLLVVDGNSWPNRLQSYLETNSVILYNGIFTDWFNGQLKPWIHFVPVRLDLADLDDTLRWLEEHDEEARRISENARAFMHGMNEIKQLRCFVGLMFLEYAQLYEA